MSTEFAIAGDFDAARVETMRAALDAYALIDDDIVIDMRNCRFLDSSGVGAVVFLYKRLNARGYRLTLDGLNGQPQRLLKHLGVADLLAPGVGKAA